MKRVVMIVLCALAVGLPVFAGGRKEAAKSGQLTFGYITQSLEFDWCKASADAFQYACDQKGVRAIIMDPQNDLEKSMSQFEDLLNQGVDG
ncbi:MAG: hypothetical protein LBQ38_00980, partial [Spirochaetaceae bacterium]|nr:hypothetical protein [Spirochaetaceae bacterium]